MERQNTGNDLNRGFEALDGPSCTQLFRKDVDRLGPGVPIDAGVNPGVGDDLDLVVRQGGEDQDSG